MNSLRARFIKVFAGFLSALALSALSVGSWAAGPNVFGPSILRVAEAGTFSGANFAPGTAVTVSVQSAGGTESSQGVVVGGDGSFSHQVAASGAGAYIVTVTDNGGATLASTNFNSMP